jgi:hypothetical protein
MRILVSLLAFVSIHAAAQTDLQQIQATSPQLIVFAGSDANLQALVNGMSLGQTVTLVTPVAGGLMQIVTFTPPSALGSDTARALEQARTNLISRGIPQPSSQQIAVALMGGTLATSAGPVQIPGVLTSGIPVNAVQVRNEFPNAGVGGTAAPIFGGSAANLQSLSNGLRQGTAITLTGVAPNGAPQNVTFTAPGGPLSQFEANQALALASQNLAAQGILSPTPDQIRAALLGGTVTASGGNVVALQGVLQGRTRNTSDSTIFGTSNSTTIGTSNSPVISSSPTSSPFISSPPSTVSPITGGNPPIPSADGVRRPSTAEGGANRGNVTGR